MNRTELISIVSKKMNSSKDVCKKHLEAMEEVMVETLKSGEKVALLGFFTLDPYTRKESEGRNPRTGEKMIVPQKEMVRFKAGTTLLDKLNDK